MNKKLESSEKNSTPKFKRHFTFTLTSFLIIILTASIISHNLHMERETYILRQLEREEIKTLESILVNHIQQVAADLHIIAHSYSMDSFIISENRTTTNNLFTSYSNTLKFRQNYDQIRYIASDGWEKIRVNYDSSLKQTTTVRKKDLQNKAHRYYFDEGMKLNPKILYMSPLDLNIEHGVVEEPSKPMIRFAEKVFDNNGNEHGIIVINYLADHLLNLLDTHSNKMTHVMLTNDEGYWLKNDDPSKCWGFMFGENNLTFQSNYPKEWDTINQSEYGQFQTSNGIFTFQKIYPQYSVELIHSNFEDLEFNSGLEFQNSYKWYLIMHTSAETLNKMGQDHIQKVQMFSSVFILIAIILSYIIARLIHRNQYYQTQLRIQAKTDILTGLTNRGAGLAILESQLKLMKRENLHLTIGFIDIDGLKHVNDTLGHNAGDSLIKTVAHLFSNHLRDSDTVIRIGGDEFLAILPVCQKEQAIQLFKRVDDATKQLNSDRIEPFHISYSYGFSESLPECIKTLEDLLEEADKEMYSSKIIKHKERKS